MERNQSVKGAMCQRQSFLPKPEKVHFLQPEIPNTSTPCRRLRELGQRCQDGVLRFPSLRQPEDTCLGGFVQRLWAATSATCWVLRLSPCRQVSSGFCPPVLATLTLLQATVGHQDHVCCRGRSSTWGQLAQGDLVSTGGWAAGLHQPEETL